MPQVPAVSTNYSWLRPILHFQGTRKTPSGILPHSQRWNTFKTIKRNLVSRNGILPSSTTFDRPEQIHKVNLETYNLTHSDGSTRFQMALSPSKPAQLVRATMIIRSMCLASRDSGHSSIGTAVTSSAKKTTMPTQQSRRHPGSHMITNEKMVKASEGGYAGWRNRILLRSLRLR